MGQFNSSLCQIFWTDVHGAQRSVFGLDEPVELRFGLRFEPSFWSSFDSSSYFVEFQVFFRGALLTSNYQDGNTLEMPGAQSEELWLGLSVGQAKEVTTNRNGIMVFRPQISFTRSSAAAGHYTFMEFARAPEDHCFLVDPYASFDGFPGGSPTVVGGSGRPEPQH